MFQMYRLERPLAGASVASGWRHTSRVYLSATGRSRGGRAVKPMVAGHQRYS